MQDSCVLAAFALAAVIHPESHEAVALLKWQGVRVAMFTGDSLVVARWVASKLGVDEYFAQGLPERESERVKELHRRGTRVEMVVDGVNDSEILWLVIMLSKNGLFFRQLLD